MKKAMFILSLLLCCVSLAGCGREDKEDSRKDQYFALLCEEEAIPEPEGKNASWRLLGRQFCQGEAVQIWAVNTGTQLDIWLYHADGSGEMLLEAASQDYNNNWYLDSSGNRYITGKELLIKLDSGGQEAFRQTQETVHDICQLQDGSMMLLVQEEDLSLRLAELDPGTGKVSRVQGVSLGKGAKQYIGAGEDGLLLMDGDGIWEVSLKDGSRERIVPFMGIYDPGSQAADFLYMGDGSAQVLQKGGMLQSLQLYDITDYREVIVLRDSYVDPEMAYYVDAFNQQSGEYYVAIEALEPGEDLDAFKERTNLDLAAGKGADIICDGAVSDVWGLVENGILEDLAPYMERDGIREGDYFPIAFDGWRLGGSIYGATLYTALSEFWIDRELLGEDGGADARSLVAALQAHEGEAILEKYYNTYKILEYFLGGTESMWGMVDWEGGTCDFSGELFAGMLEVAKRYGSKYNDATEESRPALGKWLDVYECDYYNYDYCTRLQEEEGRVRVGFLSDGGNHAGASYKADVTMGISSGSAQKEGAWEFIRFLLSQEVQGTISKMSNCLPVSKAGYDECGRRAIAEGSILYDEVEKRTEFKGYTIISKQIIEESGLEGWHELFDPTEERVAKIKAELEEARPRILLRTEPIMSIIYEEAGVYFEGDKTIEEIVPIIQNRVQLYLNEHHK